MSQQDSSVISESTGTPQTSGNAIIELDPDYDTVSHPDAGFSHDHLSFLAEELHAIGEDGLAAELEIERRHLAENGDHTLRFTAKSLTGIAVALSVAYTVNFYHNNTDAMKTIQSFGSLINRQVEAPFDATFDIYEMTGLAPIKGNGDYIDPFKAITGDQQLCFLDGNGNPVPPNEPERLDYYDPEKHETDAEFLEHLAEHTSYDHDE